MHLLDLLADGVAPATVLVLVVEATAAAASAVMLIDEAVDAGERIEHGEPALIELRVRIVLDDVLERYVRVGLDVVGDDGRTVFLKELRHSARASEAVTNFQAGIVVIGVTRERADGCQEKVAERVLRSDVVQDVPVS